MLKDTLCISVKRQRLWQRSSIWGPLMFICCICSCFSLPCPWLLRSQERKCKLTHSPVQCLFFSQLCLSICRNICIQTICAKKIMLWIWFGWLCMHTCISSNACIERNTVSFSLNKLINARKQRKITRVAALNHPWQHCCEENTEHGV